MSTNNLMDRSGQAAADLECFFSLSIDMLCIAGFDGYFKYVNAAWERTLGWTVEEMTTKPWSHFVHPDDLERTIAEADKQAQRGLEAISFDNRYLAKDGSYHWLLWNSRPSAEHGEMHAIARDVTEQKRAELALQALNESLERQVAERTAAAEERARQAERAEQALRDSEARAQAILLTAVDAIITIDEQGNIESLNPAAERVFGYPASEIVGCSVSALMPSPDRERHGGHVAEYRRTGHGNILGIGREVVGRRQDGTTFPMDLAVSEVLLADRRLFTGIVRDISERKRVEQTVRETAIDLARSNSELEAFTYSVSHDLKEPLRTLEAFSQFLLEDYADKLDADGKDHLRRLAQASARMKHLIEDLLTISRVSRQTEPTEPVSAYRVIADIVEGMRVTVHERNATVVVASGLPEVVADPRRIGQIFGNLIANGIKFNRSAAPCVEIGAHVKDSGDAVFFVRDNGIGIDARYHEKIFGVFQRLHRREEFEGTGAGLAIVRRAVEALGGSIWVESSPGEGSTFMFKLPVSPAQTAAAV